MRPISIAGLWRAAAVFAFAAIAPPTFAGSGAQTDSSNTVEPGIVEMVADLAHAEMEEMPIEVCLACHGPFDVLSETTKDWIAPSGVAVNPHISFDETNHINPHASGEGITPCTQCHVPHAIPFEEPMPAASIDTCIACHHTATFRACSECH